MKITLNEIRSLQNGELLGPVVMSRKDVHNAQAVLHVYKQKYPGEQFYNKSVPLEYENDEGERVTISNRYIYYIKRLSGRPTGLKKYKKTSDSAIDKEQHFLCPYLSAHAK